jgi:hypothetical protein
MSKEYNFVFSAFVVVFLGCFLISDSQMWSLSYNSRGFWFFVRRRSLNRTCACWKMRRAVMKVFRFCLNFS